MSNVQAKAAEASAEVESVTNAVLIEPSEANAIVALDQADAATGSEIKKRIDEIDMTDTGSIIGFGSAAQEELQVISQSMLQGVKNKDVGPAGNSLRDMVTTIRGFSVSELDLNRKQSWWEKLIGRAAPIAKFTAQFEEVQSQIDKITEDLLNHETVLLKDIKSLDLLYGKHWNFMMNWRFTSRRVKKSCVIWMRISFPLKRPQFRPHQKQNKSCRPKNCVICAPRGTIWNAVFMT